MTKHDRTLVTACIALVICGAIFGFFTRAVFWRSYNVDLPEEINLAQPGDLLQVDSVSNSITYLSFKH